MQKEKNAPTMADVAREAGVALGTVSRVVNGQQVGEEFRIKVEEYRPLTAFMNQDAHNMSWIRSKGTPSAELQNRSTRMALPEASQFIHESVRDE